MGYGIQKINTTCLHSFLIKMSLMFLQATQKEATKLRQRNKCECEHLF